MENEIYDFSRLKFSTSHLSLNNNVETGRFLTKTEFDYLLKEKKSQNQAARILMGFGLIIYFGLALFSLFFYGSAHEYAPLKFRDTYIITIYLPLIAAVLLFLASLIMRFRSVKNPFYYKSGEKAPRTFYIKGMLDFKQYLDEQILICDDFPLEYPVLWKEDLKRLTGKQLVCQVGVLDVKGYLFYKRLRSSKIVDFRSPFLLLGAGPLSVNYETQELNTITRFIGSRENIYELVWTAAFILWLFFLVCTICCLWPLLVKGYLSGFITEWQTYSAYSTNSTFFDTFFGTLNHEAPNYRAFNYHRNLMHWLFSAPVIALFTYSIYKIVPSVPDYRKKLYKNADWSGTLVHQ